MNSEKADEILEKVEGVAIKDDGKVVGRFARASEKDIQEIESLTDEELMNKIKKLDLNIHGLGIFSTKDIQKAQLCMLELESRNMLEEWQEEKEKQKSLQRKAEKKFEGISNEELIKKAKKHDVLTEKSEDSKKTRLIEEELLRRGLTRKVYS